MTVVALWLLISGANSHRPLSFIPFATKEACETAQEALNKELPFGMVIHCVPSGAKP